MVFFYCRLLVNFKGKPSSPGRKEVLDSNGLPSHLTINVDFQESFNGHRYESKSDIQSKIPKNAQATTVLVGAHGELSCPISAFIRLADGCNLGDLAEVNIPVRFLFILLGPEEDRLDYHEVGRSIATLMSDKIFLESAYQWEVSWRHVAVVTPRCQ